jgi:transposase
VGAKKKIRCGATAFRESTPWHLYVGNERVDEYLTARGLGWVVRLREELQAVDFSDLETNYIGVGRAPYHPRMMMGLIIYGTLKRKSTLRELEELAVADVGAWWICGGQQPDHSTIGNFLVRHQQHISRELFIRLVHDLAGRKGIKNSVVAGDGTVIEAAASRFTMLSQEAAEQAAAEAKKAADQRPDDQGLAYTAQQAEEIAAVARQRIVQGRRPRRGHEAKRAWVVAPIESAAVMQPCKDGRRRPSYKSSVLVHECGLIVSQAVEASREAAAIPELLDQYEAVFGAAPRTLLLDAGYHNLDVLTQIAARQIDVLCPSGNPVEGQWTRKGHDGKFGKTDFAYDADTDRYRCPAGQWLVPGATYDEPRKGLVARKYRTTQCRGCELRARCTQSKQGRALERYEGGRDQRGDATGDGAAGSEAAVPQTQDDRGAHLCGARMETRAQALSSPRAPRQCPGVQPALHRPQSEVGAASEPIRARLRSCASPAAWVAPTDHMGADTPHFATGLRQPSTLGGLIPFASR